MNTIDLSPLYRTTVGFDRFANLLDTALSGDHGNTGYPPYNIEVLDEHHYSIALAVAGFDKSELELQSEKGVLTVRGKKAAEAGETKYLHRGIATRTFERKFNLADFVEVSNAKLENGLLIIELVREVPEAMKPKKIAINNVDKVLEDQIAQTQAA